MKNLTAEVRCFNHFQSQKKVDRFSLFYRYDYDGTLISVNYNESEYFYIHNLQGDVVQTLDYNFNIVVEYIYDAWGDMTVKTDTSGISLSTINPYTYRGYRYDKETNLYYLNSRYYNPQVMCFVNADGLIAATGGILSHNMYAYTANNPVMRIDPSGYLFWDVLDVIGFASSMMDFIGDFTLANLCWLAIDTVGLLPLLPSMGTYIKGVKYFGKVDDVSDFGKGVSKLGRNLIDDFDSIVDDIYDINRKYSDGLTNNPIGSIVNSASYYDDPYEQVATIGKSISQHAFKNGNKRTAFDTMTMLLDEMNLSSPLSYNQMWDLIYDISSKEGLTDVAEIALRLQGK